MNSRFYNNMTNAMKNVYDKVTNEIEMKKEFEYCNEMYIEASKSGGISLPHTTEDGNPVLHGARLEMYTIGEYWLARRNLAQKFIDDEEWIISRGSHPHIYK